MRRTYENKNPFPQHQMIAKVGADSSFYHLPPEIRMSAPILIPREADQLVVDTMTVTKVVLGQLQELFGLNFPIEGIRSASFAVSESVMAVPYNKGTREFLKSKGYRIDRISHDTERVNKNGPYALNGPMWDFAIGPGRRNEFKFEIWFSLTRENAVTLRLETNPCAAYGNHKDAAALACLFEEFGYEPASFEWWLCAVDGELALTWEQLGIEPSVSMSKYFKDFVGSFARDEKNPIGQFVDYVAHEVSLSPLQPAPFKYSHSLGQISDAGVRVPESCHESLRARWLEQLYTFGETRFPHRPA